MLSRSIILVAGRSSQAPRTRIALYRRCSTTTSDVAEVRTRFAPSPTGMMHIGGLRTALFNYLYAKRHGGSFLLRIEDTDQTRLVEGAQQNIIDALNWAGIPYDEGPDKDPKNVGPFIQSQRTKMYQEHADKLVENGRAYRCFCTSERLDRLRDVASKKGMAVLYDRHCAKLSEDEIQQNLSEGKPYTIRLKVPEGMTTIDDMVVGNVSFNNNFIDDSILLKSDRFPTYHLANVIDDHHMKISHVIRGEEWLPSAPKHIMLYNAFGWAPPRFAHLPLLLNTDKTKLSKRHGDVSVGSYKAQGYLPFALINFVALLGWNPGNQDYTEIFHLDKLVEKFSIEQINKGGSVVNKNKLDWINGEHVKLMARDNLKGLVAFFIPFLKQRLGLGESDPIPFDPEYVEKVVRHCAVVDRFATMPDMVQRMIYFFAEPNLASAEAEHFRLAIQKPHTAELLTIVEKEIAAFEGQFDRSNALVLLTNISKLKKPKGLKKPDAFHATRYSLTGRKEGLETPLIMELLGKEEVMRRLRRAAEHVQTVAPN